MAKYCMKETAQKDQNTGETAHAGKDMEQGEHSSIVGGRANYTTILKIKLAVSQKVGNSSTPRHSYITTGHILKRYPTIS
jgi:hypothetical protein